MSWEQLVGIYRENYEEDLRARSEPPVACPNDGQPLKDGPSGELYCDFDGWVWNYGYDT